MEDENVIEEITESAPSPSWLRNQLTKLGLLSEDGDVIEAPTPELEKEDKDVIAEAAKLLSQGGYKVSAQRLAGLFGDEDEEEEMETKKNSDELTSEVIKAYLDKQQELHEEQLGAVEKKLEARYQDVIDKLEEQVGDLRKSRDTAIEKAEQREFIEKAELLRAFPVSPLELGERMHHLSKSLSPEDYQWWEATLKAVDGQIGAAGIFGEFGTSRTPESIEIEDKAAQVAKEQKLSYAEALLSLPAHEQQRLLKESRGGK